MTSKIMLTCSGQSYVIEYTKKNKAGEVIAQGELRGGQNNQSFYEFYLGQDETIEATEVYRPVDEIPHTADLIAGYHENYPNG